MKIILGKSSSKNIELDLDILLRTRLLVQANSGGGKSWLLRRIAEQFFGKIPVIIVDPEGEFASLRERFGYVLVGKGGETPCDPRSAGLVAQKLLELHASAVCDLYEMKASERHRWVRLFLESLIDAPKKFWRPTLVIVDEAHAYAPEKGAGESEASDAMIALATRGRKRGFAAVFATQRLGKLRKDAAAELLNVLIGQTFVDIDRKRAADCLGVFGPDAKAFFDQIKVLKPGQFYALGRAVSLERILLGVGPIQTTHPEPGSSKHSAEPPPPPEKVKALLPKLADLPKAAEEQAKTVAELKQEVRALKVQLREQPVGAQAIVKKTLVKVPIVKESTLSRFERIIERVFSEADRHGKAMAIFWQNQNEVAKVLLGAMRAISNSQKKDALRGNSALIERRSVKAIVAGSTAARAANLNSDESIGKCEMAILATLAQHGECNLERLALLSGYRKSGGFKNSISKLRGLGYLDGPNTSVMQITEAGLSAKMFDALPTGRGLFNYWLNSPRMGICEREIMKVLDARNDGLTLEDIGEMSGYAISGGFKNSLSKLRTAGVIIGRNTERMKLNDDLL